MLIAGRIGCNVAQRCLPRFTGPLPQQLSATTPQFRQHRGRSNMSAIPRAMSNIVEQAADTVKAVAKSVNPATAEPPSMQGKVAIVTGGNAGLGYHTSLAMAKAGARVILATRNQEKAQEAARSIQAEVDKMHGSGEVETMIIDLSDLRSVHDFGKAWQQRKLPLHVLINNAGEFVPQDQITKDGFELTVGTNHFGPWYLTQLLLDSLKSSEPSRIVWVTSPSETSTPDIDWDNLEGVGKQSDLTMYGLTKLYNILNMREFNKRCVGSGVENFAAQPGIAKTEIFGKIDKPNPEKPLGSALGYISPQIGQTAEEGARALIYAATSPDMDGKGGDIDHIVGPWYGSLGPATPYGGANIANVGNTAERPAQNELAYNEDVAVRLYEETGRILGQKVKAFDPDRQWLETSA